MVYPVWTSPSGNLGKIQALQFFNLNLEATTSDSSPVIYSLVSGRLPAGLQLDTSGQIKGNPNDQYSLDGVPEAVTQDRTSNFTVRARNSVTGQITDRNFSITVTGNYPPQILTSNYTPLGEFLDGSKISIQLNAVDLNNDVLSFTITDGELPPGITISNDGLISGILIPNVSSNLNQLAGWSDSTWGTNPWEFTTISGNYVYAFTVQASDGKSIDVKKYSIKVYAHDDIRADNVAITDDDIIVTSDTSNNRNPILLTTDLGDHSTFIGGNYFAFKFEAVDYDNVSVTYDIVGTAGTGWDTSTANPPDQDPQFGWDSQPWDQSLFALPTGLSLDRKSGWLTGFVPLQSALNIAVNTTTGSNILSGITSTTGLQIGQYVFAAGVPSPAYITVISQNASVTISQSATATNRVTATFPDTGAPFIDYSFGIQAFNAVNSSIASAVKIFTIRILNELDLTVSWNTPADLGFIDTGSVSNLSINATTTSGRQLYYYLQSGSRLPQGLTLLDNGNISGRVSFQSFSLDKGATTFDIKNTKLGLLTVPTTIDKTYKFTVVAQDYSGGISGTKTFSLKTNVVTYAPYDNLYLNCSPSIAKRAILYNILGNTDYLAYDDIYRPNDPWWGVQNDLKILVGYGLTASQSSAYISAMQRRHFNKKFYFGDYHYATAKDRSGNAIYDVIYVDLIEDTKIYNNVNGQVLKKIPASSFIDKNGTVLYPNDLDLMTNDIIMAVGTTNTNTLPQWETSIQSNGKTIGFSTAAVLAYLKPGTGPKVLYKLKNSNISDIKNVPFITDRYILDNNLDTNYNITTKTYISKNYTSFDTGYIPSLTITATVDFGLDLPFDHVNGATFGQLIGIDASWDSSTVDPAYQDPLLGWDANPWDGAAVLNGFDGSLSDYNNKYIIFTTQENYIGNYPTLTNNGWNLNGSIVPGFSEVQSGTSAVNRRAGIWYSTVVSNQIQLTFVQEIKINQVIAIRFGLKGGTTYQYTPEHVGVGAQTVPKYELINANSTQLKSPTTFDKGATVFINNEDQYSVPYANDSYLKFPKSNIMH